MTLNEAWDTDHVWAREMRVRDDQGNDHVGVAIKFRNEPGSVHFGLAAVGEHTEAILANLGCSPEEIVSLHLDDVI